MKTFPSLTFHKNITRLFIASDYVHTSFYFTATGNETVTLAEEVKKYNTNALKEFLRKEDLGLDDKIFLSFLSFFFRKKCL